MRIKNCINDIGISDETKILKALAAYEYISFDIFDTLIKRNVYNPKDVFDLVEKINRINGFSNARIEAERITKNQFIKSQYSIFDIYNNFPGLDERRDEYINLELMMEYNVCIHNEMLLNIYEECKKKHKKIILISDMYLTKEQIEEILVRCNITDYYKLYVSSECGQTKGDGGLFDYVLSDLHISNKDIIHIGNSARGDFFSPLIKGISSIKIPTHFRKVDCYRKSDCIELNYLNSFINNTIQTDANAFFKFGYTSFGPLLYGFCLWLKHFTLENNIEQIFFLARDGYMIKKAYEIIDKSNDVEKYYLEVSRRSLRVPYLSMATDIDDIIKELNVSTYVTLSQIFDGIGLEMNDYVKYISNCNLSLSTTYNRDVLFNSANFRRLLKLLFEDIKRNAKKEMEQLKSYIYQFDFEKKSILIDVGWRGSIQCYLTKILDDLSIKSDINGVYFGVLENDNFDLKKDSLFGYLFDYNKRCKFDIKYFIGFFESLFLEGEGSVKSYSITNKQIKVNRYEFEYDDEMKNNVLSIQRGALAFLTSFEASNIWGEECYSEVIFSSNILRCMISPTYDEAVLFGDILFSNFNDVNYLAHPKSLVYYLFNPKCFVKDLYSSKWKYGFIKRLFGFNILGITLN